MDRRLCFLLAHGASPEGAAGRRIRPAGDQPDDPGQTCSSRAWSLHPIRMDGAGHLARAGSSAQNTCRGGARAVSTGLSSGGAGIGRVLWRSAAKLVEGPGAHRVAKKRKWISQRAGGAAGDSQPKFPGRNSEAQLETTAKVGGVAESPGKSDFGNTFS